MPHLFLIFAAALFATSAMAQPDVGCECLWQGSFAEIADNSDVIVLGEVVAVKGNAIDLAIEAQLQGAVYFDPMRIWMRAKDYCRPEVARFSQGSRWIFALQRIDSVPAGGFDPSTPNVSYGRKGDWQLSSCGGYFLAVTGETVRGNLVPSMTRWDDNPKMQPVLVDLVSAFIDGRAEIADLEAAVVEDPALKALKLNTRSFLRGQEDFFSTETPAINPSLNQVIPSDKTSEIGSPTDAPLNTQPDAANAEGTPQTNPKPH